MRILIAEDDPVSRRVLQVTLQKWGYDVDVTSNGKDALDHLLSPDPPRLAILDWMMPGMDGIEICEKVRSSVKEPYIYILLLTAKGRKQDIIEGMNAGADDYITKPFDANELKVCLNAGNRILNLQAELLVAQETLRRQATRDPLTKLPNRLLFGDRLAHSLSVAGRRGEMVAVVFLDLDHFKSVNDTLGHSTGDALLNSVAKRLTCSLRDVDTIARMGGDEFTILVTGLTAPQQAEVVAERILQVFSKPFDVDGQEIFATPSIGVSLYPSDGTDAETLVKNADMAMYRAKESGRNNYHIYAQDSRYATAERITLGSRLHRAVEQKEFILHYQPRLDIKTGRMLGMEALVRWQNPDIGMVLPAEFIPFAEDIGLIVPIGELVLHEACTQNKAWQDAGLLPMQVAVNVSARQFHQGDILNTVRKALDETGLVPSCLELELTESTLMKDAESTVGILNELKSMGVGLSIDDFGTGYSSLSYLKRFPIDAVKIDQSFVRDITASPDDAAIAGAVIAMAHSMKLNVVAEGVETLEQLEFLRAIGCDEVQGYFVSQPVAASQFEVLLRKEQVSSANIDLRAA
jgi:diguanylate cyclase (GGDEF)-like protein